MILDYTPRVEPFAEGETVKQAILSSIFPRFIYADKATSGGHETFSRFTGHGIGINTSMGLSVVGEAYANYGSTGGAIFMFLLGLFYNFYLMILFRFIDGRHPILFFFIPMMFLLVVKAETDLTSTLNYLVKASISVAFVFYAARRFLRINI